jgi:hypothetical protein
MKKIIIGSTLVLLTACGGAGLNPSALSAIPGAPGATASNVDAGALVKQLNLSLFNLSTSQKIIFEAWGLKQEAEQAASNAKAFEAGNSVDSAFIEKSGNLDAKVAEYADKNEKLSKDGKKKLLEALPHYAKGLSASAGLGAQMAQAATSISANPASVMSGPYKATDLITVFTNSPTLLTQIASNGHKFITYSTNNGIDTKEVQSSLKDIK